MDIVSALVLVVIGLVIARLFRQGHLQTQVRTAVAPERSSDLDAADAVMRDVLGEPGTTNQQLELLGYTGLGAAEFAWSHMTIDPDVVKAAAFSSTTPIENSSDLVRYLSDHYETLTGAAKEGFANRLLGYVGEQKAAALLESQGHYVQIAAESNQPVWDLLVDGHQANIKTVADIESVEAAAAQHIDTTFFVPHDAVGHATGNIHALPGFDHQSIADSLNHAFDVVSGEAAFQAFLHHIPIVTVAFVSYRQIQDVRAGQSLSRAIAHGAFEVVGRATGAMVGGKVGGTIGVSIFGPPGLTVGSIGGAVGGALGGGKLVAKFKNRNVKKHAEILRKALEDYGASADAQSLRELYTLLKHAIERTEVANRAAQDSAAAAKSQLRYWIWPTYSDVLAVETARIATLATETSRKQMKPALSMLGRALNRSELEQIGIAMLNNPELAAALKSDDRLRAPIAQLRNRVLQERHKLDPKFPVSAHLAPPSMVAKPADQKLARLLRCPRCGAVTPQQTRTVCSFCGAVLRQARTSPSR